MKSPRSAANPNLVIAAAVEPLVEQVVGIERRLDALGTPRDGRDGLGLDAPPWSAGPKPEGAVVSHYQGQIFRALRPTDQEPGTGDHWQRVGTVGTRWRGARVEGATYEPGDVYRGADEVVYQVDHAGNPFPLAARGLPGDPGEPGADGRDGVGIDALPWRARFYREGEVVSHFQGQIFRAMADTGDEPGDSDAWERVGTVGTRWRGLRSEGMTLAPGDVYRANDGTVYQVAHNGEPFPLAARGAPGDRGEPGKAGADGRDGLGLDAPAWEPRVYREGSVVTHNLGQVFRALVDTVGEPGESADWKRLGLGGLRWRGAVPEGSTYEPGDLVTLDGSFFWTDHKGQRHLAAQRGHRGLRGDPGAPGKDGKDGAALLDVTAGTSSLVFRFGGPEGEREVEVDITDQVETVAAAWLARTVGPALEQIIKRVVELERRL